MKSRGAGPCTYEIFTSSPEEAASKPYGLPRKTMRNDREEVVQVIGRNGCRQFPFAARSQLRRVSSKRKPECA